MHTFEKHKHICHYPGSWNELTKEQLLYFCILAALQLQPQVLIVRFLRYCLNLPYRTFVKIKPEIVAEMVEHLSFLLGQSRLTVNLLPILSSLHGPEHALQNLCFEQFFWHSEPYYTKYLKTANAEYLNLLIASLYVQTQCIASLPSQYIFNGDLIPVIRDMVEPLPNTTKHAVLLFYQGCRGFLASKFPKVFSATVSASAKEDDLSPLRMLTALNNNDMTKNNDIKRTNLYEALVQMEENITQTEKTK